MSMDSKAFRDFEHRGWQQAAPSYHDAFSSITSQSIEWLLEAVGLAASPRAAVRLLDVACGPGYAGAAAAGRGASVLGIDFASEMVAEASRRHPELKVEEGDAERLELPDSSFDAVILNFGMLHLARPERALSEANRVLCSGGRIAFTVWDTPDKAVAFGIVLSAIQKHGNTNVQLPPGPPFFRFSDPAESKDALIAAGFANPTVRPVPQVWRFDSPGVVFEGMWNAAVRTGALLRAQRPDALDAIRAEIQTQVQGYRKNEGFELPMPAVLAAAVKPEGNG